MLNMISALSIDDIQQHSPSTGYDSIMHVKNQCSGYSRGSCMHDEKTDSDTMYMIYSVWCIHYSLNYIILLQTKRRCSLNIRINMAYVVHNIMFSSVSQPVLYSVLK